MRNKIWPLFWGLFFIVIGFGYGLDALGFWHFTIFFRGWWTFFIIVPSLISLIKKGYNTGDFIALLIGIILFLSARGVFNIRVIGDLIFPGILIIIGLSILFNDVIKKKINKHISYKGGVDEEYSIFASNRQNIQGVYLGSTINAIFGAYTLDLRNAVIEQDIMIKATAVFGGIVIYVPEGVIVQTSTVPIFGGATNKAKATNVVNAPTILINSLCMFGGVEIR
ncbi:MAG: cell wall-active antibiotics response protein [Clostridiales bacterium]|nr:cell wall-active antibiotics response protein [Clostridiales bacterium]